MKVRLAVICLAALQATWVSGAVPVPSTRPADAFVDVNNYQAPVRVACVGDSITAGAGSSQGKATSWPGVLSRMLDRHWIVANFGASGRTLLQKGDRPYQTQGPMKNALECKPDVVVIMLGTNDSKAQNWKLKDQFPPDYKDMIEQFKNLPTHPRIFVCLPPFVSGANRYKIEETAITEELPLIRQIADDEQAGLIDVHSATANEPANFPDHVHPDDSGATIIAKTIYSALTGKIYEGQPPAPPAPRPKPATNP